MKTTPLWPDTAKMPKFARLGKDLKVDVIVIGGGITGITAAYLLRKAGASVALLERGRLVSGETAHTTAHLTYVTDTRLSDLVERFGHNHAQATWDAGLAAMRQIHQIVEDEQIDCEFRWVPGYLHALPRKGREEAPSLQEDARLAGELGFDAIYIDEVPLMRVPGVAFADQAKFNPAKYLRGLLRVLREEGCLVFENSEASSIEIDPPSVQANNHTIRGKYIVIATHVPLQGATNTASAALFQTKLASYNTYAIGANIQPDILPDASFWDTGSPYFYLRIDRYRDHDYAILGGADHKTGQARDPQKHYERVEKRLRQIFPKITIDHWWSGQVVETNDGLPYIGEIIPRQFIATGFSGNGMTFGTLGAMMACDAFAGRRNPWSSLFDVHRKTLFGGTWNYLKENKDYPYYMLKQSLEKPGANSLRAVARGEGKVILLDGKKMAAYRDPQGKVSVKSAVCPHMGCIVRWNGVEKTWDCPCHGSRFMASGEVMAGPAESPLSDPKDEE
jgi:glycine/D-amino acid oxidase-like deaminating enzyme/nitrite reductase/ring-hydroxylating ferredoxin subunit